MLCIIAAILFLETDYLKNVSCCTNTEFFIFKYTIFKNISLKQEPLNQHNTNYLINTN